MYEIFKLVSETIHVTAKGSKIKFLENILEITQEMLIILDTSSV